MSAPSIFDTERIKDLKSLLVEMDLRAQECEEEEKQMGLIQEEKKKEAEKQEGEKVDPNFGKPMENKG